jgi:hypothetical protein
MLELLEELARLTGRHPEALNHVMQTLRTAGHVQAGRRGVISHVEAKSAASLLIACMSGAQPSDTPRAVEVYSGLRPRRKTGFGYGFPSMEFVAKADTFGQALETLLLLGPRLKREAMALLLLLFDVVPPEQLLSLEFFEVEITLQKPVPYARMTLRAANEQGFYTDTLEQEWTVDSDRLTAGYYAPEIKARSDMRTETSINHKAIFRLGDLLAADRTKEHDDEEASRVERTPQPEGRGHAGADHEGGERKPGGSYGYRESGLRLTQR